MEIRLMGTAIPCVAQQDISTGYAIRIGTDNTGQSLSLGEVIAGSYLPTSKRDIRCRYVAQFAVNNSAPPLYQSLPTLDETGNATTQAYTLRGFVSGSENLPASVTLRMVPPRFKNDVQTIPSGTLMLAYDEGIYTVTSGCLSGTSWSVGDYLASEADGRWYNDTTDAQYAVGICMEYNSTKGELTFKTASYAVGTA